MIDLCSKLKIVDTRFHGEIAMVLFAILSSNEMIVLD